MNKITHKITEKKYGSKNSIWTRKGRLEKWVIYILEAGVQNSILFVWFSGFILPMQAWVATTCINAFRPLVTKLCYMLFKCKIKRWNVYWKEFPKCLAKQRLNQCLTFNSYGISQVQRLVVWTTLGVWECPSPKSHGTNGIQRDLWGAY